MESLKYQKATKHTLVVFDLDDTLYPELTFLRSGFLTVAQFVGVERHVSMFEIYREMLAAHQRGENAFDHLTNTHFHNLIDKSSFIERCVEVYRQHHPSLLLYRDMRNVLELLHKYGVPMAVFTEGRGVTQRHKMEALGLEKYIPRKYWHISSLVGTDKSSTLPWMEMQHLHPEADRYIYVGDNPAKDFDVPNKVGWTTIGIRDTEHINIHPQTGGVAPKHWMTRREFYEYIKYRINKKYNRIIT